MKLIQKQSPNFNTRPLAATVDTVVLHATADTDTKASVHWCCKGESKVSYHTIIDRDGTVYHLVDPAKRAWHAGVSSYKGKKDVNDFSIGLSFGNNNAGEKYTDDQYRVGAAIVAQWMKRFPALTLERITTHAEIAPGRKTDPVGFDLVRFKTLVAAEYAKPALPPAA